MELQQRLELRGDQCRAATRCLQANLAIGPITAEVGYGMTRVQRLRQHQYSEQRKSS